MTVSESYAAESLDVSDGATLQTVSLAPIAIIAKPYCLSSSPELITNPGAENGMNFWDVTSGFYSATNLQPLAGLFSFLAVTGFNAREQGIELAEFGISETQLLQNPKFTYHSYVKAGLADVNNFYSVYIYFYNDSFKEVFSGSLFVPGSEITESWKLFKKDFTGIPISARYAYVIEEVDSNSAGIKIDQMSFKPCLVPQPMDFENAAFSPQN